MSLAADVRRTLHNESKSREITVGEICKFIDIDPTKNNKFVSSNVDALIKKGLAFKGEQKTKCPVSNRTVFAYRWNPEAPLEKPKKEKPTTTKTKTSKTDKTQNVVDFKKRKSKKAAVEF